MNDLLVKSFNAQCNWVASRIHDMDQYRSFRMMQSNILNALKDKKTPVGNSRDKTEQVVLDIFYELKRNLTARFETGIPLDSWSAE